MYVCLVGEGVSWQRAKTWDEAECSSHANEGLGKYSDGWEQGTVKASLVLVLSSAAGFTLHSGNSAGLLWLWHVNTLVEKRRERAGCFGDKQKPYVWLTWVPAISKWLSDLIRVQKPDIYSLFWQFFSISRRNACSCLKMKRTIILVHTLFRLWLHLLEHIPFRFSPPG